MNAYLNAPVARIASRREVVALDGAAPIVAAARVMAEHAIGSVAVREGDELVGLVTERDVVRMLALGESDQKEFVMEQLAT